MHQGPAPLALVVLGQGKGGAGDRLVDAEAPGQALHQAGFAGTEITEQQQDAAWGQLPSQFVPQGLGGGCIRELALLTVLALLVELALLLDHGGRRLPRPPSRLHSSEPEASATPQNFPNPPPSRERVDP